MKSKIDRSDMTLLVNNASTRTSVDIATSVSSRPSVSLRACHHIIIFKSRVPVDLQFSQGV